MGRTPDPLLTDLDRLLAPVSADRPCGEWLRYDGIYEQVREARREDDAALPQGVWQAELKRADWSAVERICAEALASRSKDLQLAAWLLEAWIQLDGLAGTARGFDLLYRLCSEYWQGLYPALQEDFAARLAPIRWINEKLPRRLRLLRLTRPEMESVPAYSLADWEVALRNPGSNTAQDSLTLARFQQSVTLTPHPWFLELQRDLRAALGHVRALDDFLDEKAGKLTPGLLQFRSAAESVEQLVESMVDATRTSEPEPASEPQLALEPVSAAAELVTDSIVNNSDSNDQATPAAPVGKPLRTRADAYRLLEEIATFLQQNDPHSPTPYLIWRAVAWGKMSFSELLPELVSNQSELNELVRLLRLDMPGLSSPARNR